MSWKKIAVLLSLLALLVIVIFYVDRREKRLRAVEGVLLDFPAARVEKIELKRLDEKFVFSLRDSVWYLEEPLAAKADKVAVESILDSFCPLRYDRLVSEAAGDLNAFQLDKPQIELKLFVRDKAAPEHAVLLGMKNDLDSSSYARLASGGKVVSIAAFKRSTLEKDLLAFRDKKFFEFDNLAVTHLTWRVEKNSFHFSKINGQWFMDEPVFSMARESRVEEILAAAAMLEARSFAAAPSPSSARREFGLDEPLLAAEFRTKDGSRKITVGKNGERYFALAEGGSEICEIEKDFLEKFSGDALSFREKKVAPFYSFDIQELRFRKGVVRFTVRKHADNSWRFDPPQAGKTANEEKINNLLTALADCEAREFVDRPSASPAFAARIDMAVENPEDPTRPGSIAMEFGPAEGETVLVRNPALSYFFKVGKEILEKLPEKIDDLAAEGPKIPNSGN